MGAAAGLNVGAVGAELGPSVTVGAVPDARVHERATWLYRRRGGSGARTLLYGDAVHFLLTPEEMVPPITK